MDRRALPLLPSSSAKERITGKGPKLGKNRKVTVKMWARDTTPQHGVRLSTRHMC
jgi:hypothetical protein